MRVAIVHYHLDPGGVTSVIKSACLALTAAGIRHVVLTGEQVFGLGYLTAPGEITTDSLTDSLRTAACEALGAPPDIWHFHNHSLGKNLLLPAVITRLAEAGERLVLQIHDLAEQGRPANYQLVADCPKLYPVAPRVHYAFLNSRDLEIFTAAGLPAKQSSLLPNPILTHAVSSPVSASRPAVLLAPVRGIRRKNLGELVFLSALAPAGTWFAVALAPANPTALPVHDTWRKFAKSQHLPIEFDVVSRFAPAAGAATTFDSWVEHATHFISTSVSEGFGMAFLESIARGKPLLGRNLPHLTTEHARHGIRTGYLYDRLLIPEDWIERPLLHDHLTAAMERTYRAYRSPLANLTVIAALSALTRDGYLDFGNLPEPLQQAVIERLADFPNRGLPLVEIDGKTEPAEPWLANVVAQRSPIATVAQLAPYSLGEYQKTITAVYENLLAQPVAPVRYLDQAAILTSHLAAGSFHFLLSALKPSPPSLKSLRAVIFDIYGTLLIAPAGGVRPDPAADPALRRVLESFEYEPPESPSTELHAAVLRHHAAASVAFPEVDLRALWREILSIDSATDITPLVKALEAAWHPVKPMPGAEKCLQRLARTGISLGLLANAQCNTLACLGGIPDLVAPELTILSYQHGIAKPAPELFQILTDRLAGRGITPAETLFVGNDPLQDIQPAAAAGFQTALFTGHLDSVRPGECSPDFTFNCWSELVR